jgi:hypothetical protein
MANGLWKISIHHSPFAIRVFQRSQIVDRFRDRKRALVIGIACIESIAPVHRTGHMSSTTGVATEHDFKKPEPQDSKREELSMLTKTKIALIVALVAGSASAASAQGFDPNPANRYPHYSTPEGRGSMYIGTGTSAASQNVASQNVAPRGARTLQSAPVRLQQGRNRAPVYGQFETAPVYGQFGAQQDEIGVDLRDRASSPYAGGVN